LKKFIPGEPRALLSRRAGGAAKTWYSPAAGLLGAVCWLPSRLKPGTLDCRTGLPASLLAAIKPLESTGPTLISRNAAGPAVPPSCAAPPNGLAAGGVGWPPPWEATVGGDGKLSRGAAGQSPQSLDRVDEVVGTCGRGSPAGNNIDSPPVRGAPGALAGA